MTQIKGTFEGCGEAPAPLKLNEVFISHADSTLNTARSRAVTVNVSLRSIGCLFSLANGPERTKGQTFSCYFSCNSLTQSFHFSHLVFPRLFFFFSLISLLLCHHQPPKTPSPPKLPFPSFPAGESPCIVVSSWIWKPHSEVKVREVWQQQSTLIEGGIKNSKSLCVSVERGPVTFCVLSVAGQETLWWGTKKLLLRLWLLGVLKFPLKSFPSL